MSSKKPILQLKDGEIIARYESAQAAEGYGFNMPSIRQCLLGKNKTHKGYEWQFDIEGVERQNDIKARYKKEYSAWVAMKTRCYNANCESFKHYGGRGIQVCDRWINSFLNFLDDMGVAPSKSHSIDRVDVNGDYCPGNCRWATIYVQSNNKTVNKRLMLNGTTLTVSEWSSRINVNPDTISRRLKNGWSVEKTLTTPAGNYDKSLKEKRIPVLQISKDGEMIKEWPSMFTASKSLGIPPSCISLCCKGRRTTSGGFKWKFKNKVA